MVVAFPRSSVGFRRQFLTVYHSKNLFECLKMENFVGVATLDQLVNELDPSLQIEIVKDKTVHYRRDQYIQTTFQQVFGKRLEIEPTCSVIVCRAEVLAVLLARKKKKETCAEGEPSVVRNAIMKLTLLLLQIQKYELALALTLYINNQSLLETIVSKVSPASPVYQAAKQALVKRGVINFEVCGCSFQEQQSAPAVDAGCGALYDLQLARNDPADEVWVVDNETSDK